MPPKAVLQFLLKNKTKNYKWGEGGDAEKPSQSMQENESRNYIIPNKMQFEADIF